MKELPIIMMDSKKPDPSPERLKLITDYVYSITGDEYNDTLKWILERQRDYGYHFKEWEDEIITYATCRDLCCGWFNCPEEEMVQIVREISAGCS